MSSPTKVPARARRAVGALALASALAVGGLAAQSSPAGALGSDIDGSRISWSSSLPCSDANGRGPVSIRANASYLTRSAGSYRIRLSAYTTSDALLAHGPLLQWNNVGAGARLPISWYTQINRATQAEAVAFVFRWNGSQWTLVARETVSCYG